MRQIALLAALAGIVTLMASPTAPAQDRGTRPPEFVSTEVSAEKKITFRVHAAQGRGVKLSSSDIPGMAAGGDMKKSDKGVWEVDGRSGRPGGLSLQLQRGRPGGDRSQEPRVPAKPTQHLEPGYVPGSEVSDRRTCPTGRSPRSRTIRSRSSGSAECTSTRRRDTRRARASTRSSICCTGLRLRRFVEHRRPGRLHPRQPDRRRQGQADDRRHAGGSYRAVPLRAAGAIVPRASDGRIRRRFRQGFEAATWRGIIG